MKQLTQAERIAGVFYGQMLGDALGMPSELWPRERVKRHFGWIGGFLDGRRRTQPPVTSRPGNIPTIPRWRWRWPMRCWKRKARWCQN